MSSSIRYLKGFSKGRKEVYTTEQQKGIQSAFERIWADMNSKEMM